MNNEKIIKQIEHIVNYEYDFYSDIDEIVVDLDRILKGEIVFEEVFEKGGED